MLKKDLNNFCPLCHSVSNFSKLHLISSIHSETFFCWNCTGIWQKRKRSFIDQLKHEGQNYTWGGAYFKDKKGREELIKWKTDYLKKLFKFGANKSKIIDFGCGPGIALEACERMGIEAVGIESDEANYSYCNSRGFKVIKADFNDIEKFQKLIDRSKILILFNNSLIYNKRIYNLIHNLNPNNLSNIDLAIHDQNYFLNTRNPIGVVNSKKNGFMFSSPSIRKLVNSANFEVLYSENYFGTQYLLARSNTKKFSIYKVSILDKIIHYSYSYNLRLFTPPISFIHKRIIEPAKAIVKYLIRIFKKISVICKFQIKKYEK